MKLVNKHFSFGNESNCYNTTNMELLHNQKERKEDNKTDRATIEKKDKIKSMMRNHHFAFGSDKTNYLSTNDELYTIHNQTDECNISLKKSNSTSSVPLNIPNQIGVIKMKAIMQPNIENDKGLKFFVHPLKKSIKDQKDLIVGTKRFLHDGYKSMASTSTVTLPEIGNANFIGKIENDFNSLKLSSFNLGSKRINEIPISLSKDTFKYHNDSYIKEGIYKTGFKAKNLKSNVLF